MRRVSWLSLSLIGALVGVCGAGLAQQGGSGVLGVLSFIEIDPRAGAGDEGEGRSPIPAPLDSPSPKAPRYAFVEVMHVPRWEACVRANAGKRFDEARCQPFEWSTPFIPESNADKLEEALSRAWNEFDAKVAWRMNTLVNTNPDPGIYPRGYGNRNCGSDQLDVFIDAWIDSRTGKVKKNLFCDGLPMRRPAAYVFGLCKDMEKNTRWGEVSARVALVESHAWQVYMPQYWEQVYAAVKKYMPSALKWDGLDKDLRGPEGTLGGAVMQPVYRDAANATLYRELARRARALDPKGDVYMLQRYPGENYDKATLNSVLKRRGDEGERSSWPGRPNLEALKYELSSREDIFETKHKWAIVGQARPKAKTPLSPGDDGKGLGTLEEYEGVGTAPFLQVFARVDREESPRQALFWRSCYKDKEDQKRGRLTLYNPPTPIPLPTYQVARAHTRWHSVPEGYQVRYVRGVPKVMGPNDTPAPDR